MDAQFASLRKYLTMVLVLVCGSCAPSSPSVNGGLGARDSEYNISMLSPAGYIIQIQEPQDRLSGAIPLGILNSAIVANFDATASAQNGATIKLGVFSLWPHPNSPNQFDVYLQFDYSDAVFTFLQCELSLSINFPREPLATLTPSTVGTPQLKCSVTAIPDGLNSLIEGMISTAIECAVNKDLSPVSSLALDDNPAAATFLSKGAGDVDSLTLNGMMYLRVNFYWASGTADAAFNDLASKKDSSPAPADALDAIKSSASQISSLSNLPFAGGQNGIPRYPVNGQDDGDMSLYGGILCDGGVKLACGIVPNSTSASGQPWRSPQKVGVWDNGSSFSGDQFWGVIAWEVANPDPAYFSRFLDYLNKNRVMFPDAVVPIISGSKTCLDDAGALSNCALDGDQWHAIQLLAQRLDVADHLPTDDRDAVQKFGLNSREYVWEAFLEPPGFQSHLLAVQIWLFRQMGFDDSNMHLASDILAVRQPPNAFFRHLADYDQPKKIPLSAASYKAYTDHCGDIDSLKNSALYHWAWQEDSVQSDKYKDPVLWDCLFAAQFLQQPSYGYAQQLTVSHSRP